MKRALLLASFGFLVACGPPPRIYWREMLGKSIADFTDPLQDNGSIRVWIHNMDDKECDKGCQAGVQNSCKGGEGSGSSMPSMPSFSFGGGDSKTGPWDGLAYEVFSNYVTQKRKGKVVESHHHNYATELNANTHKVVEVISEGKAVGSFASCEDLCILDEAKKRRADKILAYQILEMKNEELLIHLRFSDGKTGLVELSRTLRIQGMSVTDSSF